MQPSSPSLFEQLISTPRLDSYRGYFRATRLEAIGLYLWNSELSANLAVLLGVFEVVLRNRLHLALSRHHSRGASDSSPWYDSRTLDRSLQNKIAKVRAVSPAASANEIVSRVTFGFWPSVAASIGDREAAAILAVAFPFHPLSSARPYWTDARARKRALAYLYELQTLRNRIAHHEPLWKFQRIVDTSTIPATVVERESLSPEDSVSRFRRVLRHLDVAFANVDPTLRDDLRNSSWRQAINALLSRRGLARYRRLQHTAATAIQPQRLESDFGSIVRRNRPVRVRSLRCEGVFNPV